MYFMFKHRSKRTYYNECLDAFFSRELFLLIESKKYNKICMIIASDMHLASVHL